MVSNGIPGGGVSDWVGVIMGWWSLLWSSERGATGLSLQLDGLFLRQSLDSNFFLYLHFKLFLLSLAFLKSLMRFLSRLLLHKQILMSNERKAQCPFEILTWGKTSSLTFYLYNSKQLVFPYFHIIYSNSLILCEFWQWEHAESMTKDEAGEKEISKLGDRNKRSKSVKERRVLYTTIQHEKIFVWLYFSDLFIQKPRPHTTKTTQLKISSGLL